MTMNNASSTNRQETKTPPEGVAQSAQREIGGLENADLNGLIAEGRRTGYLTFDQVNEYLPDEAMDPEKIDALLVALDGKGIELVEELPEYLEPAAAAQATPTPALSQPGRPRRDEAITTPPSNAANDPIRMYLAQMAEILLLTREE